MPFHVMKEESTSSLQRTRLRSPLNSISLGRSKETCAASYTTSRVKGLARGFVVAGSPRLRARCCAARTRPTSLSSLLAFRPFGIGAPSGSWWLGRASLRPEVPGRTAASGLHEIARGQVVPLRVGSHRARIIQFKSGPGPGSHRFPSRALSYGAFTPRPGSSRASWRAA